MTSPTPAPTTIPRRRRRNVDPAHPVYELDVWLGGSEPVIWRSLAVPADLSLSMLHRVIQAVMEWEDHHLHQFQTKSGRRFEPRRQAGGADVMWKMMFAEGGAAEDESRITLRDLFEELKEKLAYTYDFGDSWVHVIKLIDTHVDASAFDQLPVCLAGERAGPPEDSGGIWDYEEKLEILRAPDPNDEWHEEVIEWLGGRDFDPEAFDIVEKNRRIKAACRPQPKRASRGGGSGGGGRGRGGTKRRRRKSR
jgi:hypothetical protein